MQREAHRLPLAHQVRDRAPVGRLERAAVRARVEALHDRVEVVRVARVEEVEARQSLEQAPLELHVLDHVGRGERRRAQPVKSWVWLLVVEQLRPLDAHELDPDADQAVVAHVGRRQRARPAEAHPGSERPRARRRRRGGGAREGRQHLERPSHHAVGLRIADALGDRCGVVLRMNALWSAMIVRDRLRLAGQDPLLGDAEILARPAPVDQRLHDGHDRRPQHAVEAVAVVAVEVAQPPSARDDRVVQAIGELFFEARSCRGGVPGRERARQPAQRRARARGSGAGSRPTCRCRRSTACLRACRRAGVKSVVKKRSLLGGGRPSG